MPNLYIILPVHNRRAITTQFVQALKRQTFPNANLILVDDGSTDGTADAVLAEFPNTHVISGDGNLWWGGGLQKGFDYLASIPPADEDVVLICNDDVIIEDDFIETGISLLNSRPPSLLLAQNLRKGDEMPLQTGMHVDRKEMRFRPAPAQNDINCLSTRGLFMHWGTIKQIGGFRLSLLPHYGSDFEFTMRAHAKGFVLWTDPRLHLSPLSDETGVHGVPRDATFTQAWRMIFTRRSALNPFMRSRLFWLCGDRKYLHRYMFTPWRKTTTRLLRGAKVSLFGPRKNAGRLHIALPVHGGAGWIGGSIYVRNLIYCLASLPEADRPIVRIVGALSADKEFLRDALEFDFVEANGLYVWARRFRITRLAFSILNAVLVRLLGPKGNPETWGTDVTYPARRVDEHLNNQIFWIPDFQHLRLPEMFSDEERERRSKSYQRLADSDGTLVLSSQDALNDFNEFFPNAKVKTQVWNFCTVLTANEEGGQDPHTAYGLPEKYIYIANQFWAHKDHLCAFKAVATLKEQGIEIQVVCTGEQHDYRNRDHMAKLTAFIAEHGLEEQVHLLGLVPRNDQIEIFRHAAGVLQPSLFEGWSTVVEDTRATGRPIVLSDIGVHVEQAPPEAVYFKAGDANDLARVLADWWPGLKPGPDVDGWADVLNKGDLRRQQTGQTFIRIIAE